MQYLEESQLENKSLPDYCCGRKAIGYELEVDVPLGTKALQISNIAICS